MKYSGKWIIGEIINEIMRRGSVRRTIKYVAPFDHSEHEQDYETARKFFEEKYEKI